MQRAGNEAQAYPEKHQQQSEWKNQGQVNRKLKPSQDERRDQNPDSDEFRNQGGEPYRKLQRLRRKDEILHQCRIAGDGGRAVLNRLLE